MVNWSNVKLEFDMHAFKHGVHEYEIEEVFRDKKIYKRKIKVNGEERYIIVGKSFRGILMLVAQPLKGNRLKVFSARYDSSYKVLYNKKAK